jgi:hypothetical protein
MLGISIVGVLLAGAAYAAYRSGRDDTSAAYDVVDAERSQLRQLSKSLDEENGRLRRRVAVLERAAQVKRKAYADVDESVKAMQSKVLDLKEELAFYRGIVASTSRAERIDIRSFDVQGNGRPRGYRYRIVLTRFGKDGKVVHGKVSLSVLGKHDGRAKRLTFTEVADENARSIDFQLKNFKRIEGQVTLPDGFVPKTIRVVVEGEGKRTPRSEKSFDWPSRRG